MKKAPTILMLLAFASTPSLAATPPAKVPTKPVDASAADADAWKLYEESIRSAMRQSDDPREWALAVLAPGDDVAAPDAMASTRAELARAAEHAPDDALVQWLAVNIVGVPETNDGHIAAALARLQTLEPDNAAVWMQALGRAVKQHDDSAMTAALAGMAQSTRFDEHFADTLHAWLAAYDRYPPAHPLPAVHDGKTELSWAFVSAMARTSAIALPSYATLTNACKTTDEESFDDGRRTQCAAVGKLMLYHSPTLIAKAIGFAVLHNLGALTDADLAENRNLDWYRANILKGTGYDDGDVSAAQAFESDWRHMNDEIAVIQNALRRAGLPAEAPANWSPPGKTADSTAKS